MPLLSYGDYRPDVADYEAQSTQGILNVIPRGDGYGPFRDLSAYSAALGAACRGAFVAYKGDGSVVIFAATSTRIYKMDNSALTWTDVSKGGSAYSGVPSADNWQFEQFGNYVVAVQVNTAPQVFDITSSTAFADLSGSPPTARYVRVVGRFLVLSGLSSYPYRIHWSGLNDITQWTSGVNSSDYQDFPDGGIVRGVAGGEYGLIFQDYSIRRMSYAPGAPYIFQIERVNHDRGLYGSGSIIQSGDKVFFFSTQGFCRVDPGAMPVPIGRERVDRTFFADLDQSNLQLLIGASDPRNMRVFWAYKSVNGTSYQYDKVLCYDYALDKWSLISVLGEYLFNMSQPGLTLEALDAISSSIDSDYWQANSFDSISNKVTPEIAAFDTAHKMGFFRGQTLEATLETSEQGTDGKRLFIRGFRPIGDAPSVYGSVSYRENVQDDRTWTSETAVNSVGVCPQRRSTRYARAKVRIPAATSWNYAAGVELDVGVDGLR